MDIKFDYKFWAEYAKELIDNYLRQSHEDLEDKRKEASKIGLISYLMAHDSGSKEQMTVGKVFEDVYLANSRDVFLLGIEPEDIDKGLAEMYIAQENKDEELKEYLTKYAGFSEEELKKESN